MHPVSSDSWPIHWDINTMSNFLQCLAQGKCSVSNIYVSKANIDVRRIFNTYIVLGTKIINKQKKKIWLFHSTIVPYLLPKNVLIKTFSDTYMESKNSCWVNYMIVNAQDMFNKIYLLIKIICLLVILCSPFYPFLTSPNPTTQEGPIDSLAFIFHVNLP